MLSLAACAGNPKPQASVDSAEAVKLRTEIYDLRMRLGLAAMRWEACYLNPDKPLHPRSDVDSIMRGMQCPKGVRK